MEMGGVEGGGAHEHVRVTVDVLCDAVHDNVGAVVQRVLDVGREEGVVNDDHDAVVVRDRGNRSDIHQR